MINAIKGFKTCKKIYEFYFRWIQTNIYLPYSFFVKKCVHHRSKLKSVTLHANATAPPPPHNRGITIRERTITLAYEGHHPSLHIMHLQGVHCIYCETKYIIIRSFGSGGLQGE